MSVWMHVHGLIRISSILDSNLEGDIAEILGKPISYENLVSDNEEETAVPMGSEGSLEYKIISHGDISSIVKAEIAVFGDLRDYEEIDYVENWIRKIIDQDLHKHLWVRDLAIHAYIEAGRSVFFFCADDLLKKVVIDSNRGDFP